MSYTPLTFAYDPDFATCENGAAAPDDVSPIPTLSAYNEATEGWRIGRIAAAWGAASSTVALLSNRYRRQWPGAIRSLNDSKGTLEVTWRDDQSRVLFEGAIMGAWERSGEHSGAHALVEEN